MTATEFRVFLREGIAGGFAPAEMKNYVEIRGDSASGAKVLRVKPKADNKKEFVTTGADVSTENVSVLVNMLETQLKELPTEEPKGIQDIYGLDTSLSFVLGDQFEWTNGVPEGCGEEQSSRQATEEQKAMFAALAELILKFGETHAP